jgi:hypothetical protein
MNPELEWRTDRVDGVVLLAVTVDNRAAVPCHVRVESRLDGPILPPRSSGTPEAGWDREGYEGVVPADGRLALGYACPCPDSESASLPTPPVELTEAERAPSRAGEDAAARPTGTGYGNGNAAAVVRELGRGTPPRDAVPDPVGSRPSEPWTAARPRAPDATTSPRDGDDGDTPEQSDDGPPGGEPARYSPSSTPTERTAGDADGERSPPEDVERWLDTVEVRVELAESLTDPSLPAATAALGTAGGLDPALSSIREVDRDAAALRRVADRAGTLAERAEATDVPFDALRRLA